MRTVSRLGALFRWQSGKKTSLEDFCTEGLATAVVSDPSPFLELLESREMLPGIAASEITGVQVLTQGPIEGTKKRVDLQVELEVEKADSRAVWIEVKTGAQFGMRQLESYQKGLDAAYPDGAGRLIVLSIAKRGSSEQNLRWQEVWKRVEDSSDPNWLDLRRFLEERNVADRYNEPMTPEEFAGTDAAYVALRKTARSMATLVARIDAEEDEHPGLLPAGLTGDEFKLRKQLAKAFHSGYGFVAGGNRWGARLRLGVRHDKELGTDVAFVMIKTRKTHTKIRQTVWSCLDGAGEGRFGPIAAGIMRGRGVSMPLAELTAEGALTDWWLEQFKALHACGALQKCGVSLEGGESDEGDENDEDA